MHAHFLTLSQFNLQVNSMAAIESNIDNKHSSFQLECMSVQIDDDVEDTVLRV